MHMMEKLLNKSYCPLPFKEIYTDHDGNYKLCCHARITKKAVVNETLPFDWFFSDYLEDVRQKMIEGEILSECNKCTLMEKYGSSHRQKAISEHGLKSDVEKVRLKLRINGSACNLACYMCHPYNSSERRKEFKAIWGKNIDNYFLTKGDNDPSKIKFSMWDVPIKRNNWNDIVNNILDNIHLIDNIHMTGGEPLQLPRHWELVDKIPSEFAKNIKLTYDSNITKLNYKNHHILDLKDKFGDIFIGCSADHYGKKLEYMRYPIDHKVFEENLKFVAKNFRYSLNITVALLNINDLEEIVEYYNNLGITNIYYGVLTVPRILSIRNVSDKHKKIFNEKYSHSKYHLILSELNKPIYNKNWYDVFSDYMNKLYGYRNLDWESTFDVKSYCS